MLYFIVLQITRVKYQVIEQISHFLITAFIIFVKYDFKSPLLQGCKRLQGTDIVL